MTKKLIAIGNSYGLVIDKAILELLRITPETELELSTDGTRLVIEPVVVKARTAPRPVVPKTPPRARLGFPKKQPW